MSIIPSHGKSPENGRIAVNLDICNGRPTIRGVRIAVETVLDFLSAGESQEEILRQYPSLEPADIDACLLFAAEHVKVKHAN